uniref:Astacin domain-containing protein n=1 Tax=Strongyloides papillosus TaxID=174720 RepID=A0A0N5B218_STREA
MLIRQKIFFIFTLMMKISLVVLLLLLCIMQGFATKESKESTTEAIKRPPYPTDSKLTYYYVDKNFRGKLTTIFNQISRYTCLKFKYKADGPISKSIGINFENSSTGNNTVVLSDNSETPTTVSLTEEAFKDYKNLSFYVGLALNITPEVRRYDGKEDIDISKENIDDWYKGYYEIQKKEDTPYLEGTEFDFGSPMLVNTYFGRNNKNKPTYEVKMYNNYQPFFGDGRIFRHNDYKHMFNYYCSTISKTVECKNGGYYPGTSEFSPESKCKCPDYFSGKDCGDLQKNEGKNCNEEKRELTATSGESSLEITNNDGRCHYRIKSDDEKKNVKVIIKNLQFENNDCSISGVYLEVLVRNDKGAKGIFLCRNSSDVELPTLSNQVIVAFYGKGDNNNYLKITFQTAEKK